MLKANNISILKACFSQLSSKCALPQLQQLIDAQIFSSSLAKM